MSACECPKCHREFTGLSTFDAHQDVDYSRPHADIVRCQDPAALGMARDRFGRWGSGQKRPSASIPSISAGLPAPGAGVRT